MCIQSVWLGKSCADGEERLELSVANAAIITDFLIQTTPTSIITSTTTSTTTTTSTSTNTA